MSPSELTRIVVLDRSHSYTAVKDSLSPRADCAVEGGMLFEAGTATLASHLHLLSLSGRVDSSRNYRWLNLKTHLSAKRRVL